MVLSELTKRNHFRFAAHLVTMQNSCLVQGGRGCFDLPKQDIRAIQQGRGFFMIEMVAMI